MKGFDIVPFDLPNAPEGEFWFEESRDIREVVVRFRTQVPGRIEVHYWQHRWPEWRIEEEGDLEDPARFGWSGTDDWFNGRWRKAGLRKTVSGKTASLTFSPLRVDGLEHVPAGYDVDFRRTMGLRIVVPDLYQIRKVEVLTCSTKIRRRLRVELDAGRRTAGRQLLLSGYNTRIRGCGKLAGVRPAGEGLVLGKGRRRGFELEVECMAPAHRYCGDGGLMEFTLDRETFTISLETLDARGPIWYAEKGVFITRAEDRTTFAEYRRQCAGAKTVEQLVKERPEQSYARSYFGQPRPHAVAYSFGCKHSPQRFWLDPNGDVVLHRGNLTRLDRPGASARRFLNRGNARFFFGMENWVAIGRCTAPPPVLACELRFRKDALLVEQQVFCIPLERSILEGELGFDDITVALVRFRYANAGDQPVEARLPVRYSEDSGRSRHILHHDPGQTEHLVPVSPLAPLAIRHGRITSQHRERTVLRCVCETTMRAGTEAEAVLLRQKLNPGECCEALFKIPYVALDSKEEIAALEQLAFSKSYREMARFWREESEKGSQLRSPVPQLDALYAAHLAHVEITDFSMPDDPELINTSVGTSTYGNFSNESCMIVQELDQRGFHEDCRRRLDLWVKYQGTVPQPGNFTDCEGMYFGAGGFEQGSYNQHHGWVLWAMAEHFLLTRDLEWFEQVADSVIAGADWIFRQRRETMKKLPRSRGWEWGFLPAGSLEDVTEFYYWLSTNCLTWRGADAVARALEACRHPQAKRVRRQADAYRRDLIRGFETMRQHAPLVRLRDGRWVPHYPSRLYCRGRDQGWIREVLEGAVYLLLSGLYDARSKQGSWILDDYQDNLYLTPPYGYVLGNQQVHLFNRGGFSIQPCLLAGLLPYLERDEPEIYLWMFFNAFAAVFREEVGGLIEHPLPELGFSNSVTFKTSDEANAVMWLRYMLVYWDQHSLHFGRALPRAWLAHEGSVEINRVRTYFGEVGVRYEAHPAGKWIAARIETEEIRADPHVRVRFRHPEKLPIREVRVAGRPWSAFSGEDVDITGLRGTLEVEARF